MSCKVHEKHEHVHGAQCGHLAVKHEGHTDYLHDSHLHYVHEGHVDEHVLGIDKTNAADCTPSHSCKAHTETHKHSANCGHAAIPHGNHIDYIVAGHLHSPHQGHCDDHGKIGVD